MIKITKEILSLLSKVDATKHDKILFQAWWACSDPEFIKINFGADKTTTEIEYACVERYVEEEVKKSPFGIYRK